MGGKALKNCTLRRITAAEYVTLSFHILSIVRRYYTHANIPSCFSTKPDHGDLDIVVSIPMSLDTTAIPTPMAHSLKPTLTRKLSALTLAIAHEFQSKDLFSNGPVTSFEHAQFQIDLIHVPPQTFRFAVAYLSWGDLGNMLGVVANRLGVSYGVNGLNVNVFSPLHGKSMRIGQVTLTMSFKEALDFLGYDTARWEKGFEGKEEVFEFAASGKYFESWMFCRRELNNRNRKRIGKRPVFNEFLEYVRKRFPTETRKSDEEEEEEEEGEEEEEEEEEGEDEDENHRLKLEEDEEDGSNDEHSLSSLQLEHRTRALETFGKQAEYQLHLDRYEATVRVRELWTPAVQKMSRTRELQGKELGKFVPVFKKSKMVFVDGQQRTWEDWVLAQENTEAIVADMEKYHDDVWKI